MQLFFLKYRQSVIAEVNRQIKSDEPAASIDDIEIQSLSSHKPGRSMVEEAQEPRGDNSISFKS